MELSAISVLVFSAREPHAVQRPAGSRRLVGVSVPGSGRDCCRRMALPARQPLRAHLSFECRSAHAAPGRRPACTSSTYLSAMHRYHGPSAGPRRRRRRRSLRTDNGQLRGYRTECMRARVYKGGDTCSMPVRLPPPCCEGSSDLPQTRDREERVSEYTEAGAAVRMAVTRGERWRQRRPERLFRRVKASCRHLPQSKAGRRTA